jgi:TonB family protein
MTFRSLVVATALVLPACAGVGQELRAPEGPSASVPKIDLTARHLAFPAIRGEVALPSADATAMHMQKVLGDSADADVLVCVDGTGKVASAKLLRSSGLAAFDAGVVADVKAWQFEAPSAAACTDLTIAYSLQ